MEQRGQRQAGSHANECSTQLLWSVLDGDSHPDYRATVSRLSQGPLHAITYFNKL